MDFKPCQEGGNSFLKPMGVCFWFIISSCLEGPPLFVATVVMRAWMVGN